MIDSYKALVKALDNFEASQKPTGKAGKAGAQVSAPIDVCATYKKFKPVIVGLLPFIGAIPGVGTRIVTGFNVLMAALDAFCPSR